MRDVLIPTLLFAISMTATPGPNNMLLTAAGASFGFKRTVPVMIGMVLGFQSQLLLGAIGLGAVFTGIPLLQNILRIVGVGYLLYLAWRIAFAAAPDGGQQAATPAKPLKLIEGALFQYVNPKAWIASMTAMSVYPLPGAEYTRTSITVALVFLVIMPLSISLWAAFGTLIGGLLAKRIGRWLNIALGVLTAASAVFVVT